MLKKQKTPPPRLINQKREEEEEEKSRRAVPINPGTHTQRTQITQGTHTHTHTWAGRWKQAQKEKFILYYFFFQVLFTYGWWCLCASVLNSSCPLVSLFFSFFLYLLLFFSLNCFWFKQVAALIGLRIITRTHTTGSNIHVNLTCPSTRRGCAVHQPPFGPLTNRLCKGGGRKNKQQKKKKKL